MSRSFTRIVIASLAVVSLAGMAAPVQAAAPASPQLRNVWCC